MVSALMSWLNSHQRVNFCLPFKRQCGPALSLVHLLVQHRVLIHRRNNDHGAGGYHATQQEHRYKHNVWNPPPRNNSLSR